MRIIEAQELQTLIPFIDRAVQVARTSPCEESKRGVVLFRGDEILGEGCNKPIAPRICVPRICQTVCAEFTVHAERNAIQDAIASGANLAGANILHMRVKYGEVGPAKKLTCPDCVPYMMRVQQTLAAPFGEFILEHEIGFVALKIEEMNYLLRQQ